jgi:progressive ankylosis protein
MTPDRSPRAILAFWIPLALQWVMMALEVPFLAAVVGRLPDPAFNLAAYGVAYAFAILVESPVIMLMSAATALVADADGYRKLHRFAWMLNLGATALLLVVLIPPVYDVLMRSGVGLPDRVADLAYGALWLLLPWPAAIGYRRFLHGLLIGAGRTRRVAYGTGVRLLTMGATALLLAATGIPGVWVGAASLSAGVIVEALVAVAMSREVVRDLKAREPATTAAPLHYGGILRFYYPLALTSFIGLTTKPLLTFFMGRAPAPVESLALFPVVVALVFLFGSLGLSFQEAAIALVGRQLEHLQPIRRFAITLALSASACLAVITFTPLAGVWFGSVSGLPPELVALALVPARVAVLMPLLSVALAYQRALLVQLRNTRPITVATALEVGGMALLFPLFGWGFGLMGVTAAIAAQLGGRALGVGFLTVRARRLRVGTAMGGLSQDSP